MPARHHGQLAQNTSFGSRTDGVLIFRSARSLFRIGSPIILLIAFSIAPPITPPITASMLVLAADASSGSRPTSPPQTASQSDTSVVDANPGWPSIRGPHGNGLSPETDIADRWPDSGPPILWVKELGQGYSSLVAKDGRVYTQYQTLGGQYVICMDAGTGKTIWQYRYDWPFESAGLYPGPRSTPTLAAGRVYFTTPAGAVGCLSESGKLIWQHELTEKYGGRGTDFGYACSPTVIDGKVLMPVGGRAASMVALGADDGALIWKSGDAPAS